ncbi:hypothetical protein ACQPXM_33800 [Kribbella sp. CA-253562]|uniref:hypothetical protein n=1 Tax=Kribbella sp. CA-253562 TaxID=3239942 RepID=UPI003D8C570F
MTEYTHLHRRGIILGLSGTLFLGLGVLMVGDMELVWERAWWAFLILAITVVLLIVHTTKALAHGHSLLCSIRRASYAVV